MNKSGTEPARRSARARKFLHARLSPEGYFGLHLTVGVAIILAAGGWFADIAEDMSHEAATRLLDENVAQFFHRGATPLGIAWARAGSFVGSVGFLAVVALIACAVLLWRRAWPQVFALALAVGGGSVLNILLKHLFHRQRPVLENPLVTLASFGFPSGHTMGSTLCYGVLALCVARSLRGRIARTSVLLCAAVLVATIGFTRIYLGAHYLTDVLGALAAGVAWLTVSWTGVETLRRWRGSKRVARQNPAPLD